MSKKFDFVSHHPYWGVLLWNEDDMAYNLWMPCAFADLESALLESRVRDGIVVPWSWPSALNSVCNNIFVSDLPF